jgi:hypothetical protein
MLLESAAAKTPFDEEELNFTISYSDNFKVLPTFAVVVGTKGDLFERLMAEFNPMMLLHGEQKVEVFGPLPPTFEGRNVTTIVDIQDKKSGALVITETRLTANDGTLIAKSLSKIFIRGIGGFGDAGIINDRLPSVPSARQT